MMMPPLPRRQQWLNSSPQTHTTTSMLWGNTGSGSSSSSSSSSDGPDEESTTTSTTGGDAGQNTPDDEDRQNLIIYKSICTFDSDEDFALPSGPDNWPYTKADLNRLDNSDDSKFYQEPRFVTHIDDDAIDALTSFYKQQFTDYLKTKTSSGSKEEKQQEEIDVLDLCSSWISHLPPPSISSSEEEENNNAAMLKYGKVVGVGMNEAELQANKQLTRFITKDLNVVSPPSSSLLEEEFDDETFDFVLNVVSVDYLTSPLEVFQEMFRVLRPGGVALISFSNRCFPTKAVAMWLQADEIDRITIVASYFHYSSKDWTNIEAFDLRPKQETPERPSPMDTLKNPSLGLAWMNAAASVQKNNQGDPMFVVKAIKKNS